MGGEGEHKQAVEACSEGATFKPWPRKLTWAILILALLDDPEYVKVLQRRAASNEALGTWSSLSAAQGGVKLFWSWWDERLNKFMSDYNTLLEILSESDSRRKDISAALQKLKPRVEAAQKQETAEMLDKLKGFGNNILGRLRGDIWVVRN